MAPAVWHILLVLCFGNVDRYRSIGLKIIPLWCMAMLLAQTPGYKRLANLKMPCPG
jgi:hypothetical protein